MRLGHQASSQSGGCSFPEPLCWRDCQAGSRLAAAAFEKIEQHSNGGENGLGGEVAPVNPEPYSFVGDRREGLVWFFLPAVHVKPAYELGGINGKSTAV